MNIRKIASIIATVTAVSIFSVALMAGGEHHKPAPVSPDFARLQKLVGTWEGTHKGEKGEEKVKVVYTLSSGNSALVETMNPGSPDEMITIYTSDGNSVVMTHYCMLGNQPRMKLSKSDERSFNFKFKDGTNMKKSDPHMHSLKITMPDDKNLNHEWTHIDDKKKEGVVVMNFKRI